ncbi:MAG: DUF3800 domain-containing protein [Anaerolineae bacterium]|nr:DUF3800 domain-containing protein [Anaerolineae bacterium]
MQYAFLDESGNVDPFSGSHFLVVAVLATSNPRPLALHVKRMQKRLGRRPAVAELKASASLPSVSLRLLRAIAQENIGVIAAIVDKRHIYRPPKNLEDLDKRYTKRTLRYDLEETIREGLVGVPQEVVLIRQEDSVVRKELQAVDCVAWAFFQKYEHGDDRFYRIIADKVIVEDIIRRKLW